MGFAKTIIGVDDDPSILDFLKVVCEANGHEFHGANSGQGCLDLLEDVKPDIILLDINMPDVDGMQTLANIKDLHPGMSAPIVFLSGETDAKTIGDVTSKGGSGYIMKPINGKRLIEKIENAIDRAQWASLG